jgi:capsular polysaccharide biosynthesis protein
MNQEKPPQKQYPENYPYQEDEINLIDCLRVIWKWKWLIIAATLIFAIAAAVISFQMPRIYEISTVIEPGIAGVKNDGGFIYIDSVVNINERINEGIYNRKIKKALNLDPLKTLVKFKSVNFKQAKMVKVTSQWQEGDTDLGVKVVRQMIRFLSDDYAKIVGQRKGDYHKQIKLKLSSIARTQNEIKLQQANLKNIRQRKEELLEEIKGVKENTEKIIQQRDRLLKDKNPGKDLSLLLYSNTIQQNVSYFNQLSNQVYGLGNTEKEIETGVNRLSKNIDDINSQIKALELEKGLISNIVITKEPEVSLHPVKPKKRQIVLLTGVVSLFMAVFLAFFIEYIRKASKSIKKAA